MSSGPPHPTPSWGQAPALHSSASTTGFTVRSIHHPGSEFGTAKILGWAFAGMMSRRSEIGASIPNRSPGHVFIAIAHAGWRRHTKV